LGARLLEGDEGAWFVTGCAGVEELQAHERLAGTRGAGDERRRAGPVAVAEGFVEGGDPGREPGGPDLVARRVDGIGQARVDDEPVAGQAVGVVARGEVAPSQLDHPQVADRPFARALGGELDHRVGHRELG
jgi:hypothetical protein